MDTFLSSRFTYHLFTYSLFVLCLLQLCSCEEEVKYNVFKYNQTNPITSLDPAFAKSQNNIWACHHLYNTLVRFDSLLNIEGDLAKDYSISEDGLIYTFNLRPNILFHENDCFGLSKTRTFNAHDVVYSLSRIQDGEINSPGSWIFKDKIVKNGFQAIDSMTFKVELKQAFAPFLGLLAMKYCSIIPKEALEYYGASFRNNPVGTGPMKLKKWLENEALFLTRNKTYFRNNIFIDGVKTSFITDRKMAYLELLNGNLDFVSGLESSFIHRLLDENGHLKEENKRDIKLYKSPYLNTEYIGINVDALDKASPLQKAEVRRALNMAINKSQLLEVLRNNVGIAATEGIIPFGLPSFKLEGKGSSYKPKEAKEILQNAGFLPWPSNQKVVVYTNADYQDIITYVGRQWQNIGIDVEIEILESSLLRAGMRSGEIGVFRASWIADYPDGENFLCLFYGENPAPPNYTRYKNNSFDQKYKASIQSPDKDFRNASYNEMEKIMLTSSPIIPLYYDQSSIFTSSRVEKITTNALNLLEIEGLKLSN